MHSAETLQRITNIQGAGVELEELSLPDKMLSWKVKPGTNSLMQKIAAGLSKEANLLPTELVIDDAELKRSGWEGALFSQRALQDNYSFERATLALTSAQVNQIVAEPNSPHAKHTLAHELSHRYFLLLEILSLIHPLHLSLWRDVAVPGSVLSSYQQFTAGHEIFTQFGDAKRRVFTASKANELSFSDMWNVRQKLSTAFHITKDFKELLTVLDQSSEILTNPQRYLSVGRSHIFFAFAVRSTQTYAYGQGIQLKIPKELLCDRDGTFDTDSVKKGITSLLHFYSDMDLLLDGMNSDPWHQLILNIGNITNNCTDPALLKPAIDECMNAAFELWRASAQQFGALCALPSEQEIRARRRQMNQSLYFFRAHLQNGRTRRVL